jgi:hypothetical protein
MSGVQQNYSRTRLAAHDNRLKRSATFARLQHFAARYLECNLVALSSTTFAFDVAMAIVQGWCAAVRPGVVDAAGDAGPGTA